MPHRRRDAGAALFIALAILTLLMFLSLWFYLRARQSVTSAINAENALRADFLADGGIALAMAYLNQDLAAHAMYTSTDHAWKTFFNGAAFVGKPSMWRDGVPITSGGVPEVPHDVWWDPSYQARKKALYYPRIGDDATGPFVTTLDFDTSPLAQFLLSQGQTVPSGLGVSSWPIQQIHFFGDVDNDDDGYKDSIWLPMGADRFFPDDGLDNDLDGYTDEGPNMLEDGIDNDHDGLVDEADEAHDGIDNDGDGVVDEDGEFPPIEAGIFVYWGGDDGLDNDGDGLVDETAATDPSGHEQKPFFTAPIVDQYNNSVTIRNLVRYPGTDREVGFPPLDASPGSPHVDVLDNDFTLIVNDSVGYAYNGPNDLDPATWTHGQRLEYRDDLAKARHKIAPRYLTGIAHNQFTNSGEPVCELIGRVAILITDEASKVNINAAGAHTMDPSPTADRRQPIRRAIAWGISPAEHETRHLPGIGKVLASRLWGFRTGGTEGIAFVEEWAENRPCLVIPDDGPSAFDRSLPGYGGVDDNGNALWLAINGLDDNGDGLVDEGVALPNYPLEGIDEPQEFQYYRPLRNPIAENDRWDNNANNSVDEIGEFGDRVFANTDQMKAVRGIGGGTYLKNRELTTTHSMDRNDQYNVSSQRDLHNRPVGSPESIRGKFDYNYAFGDVIGHALVSNWHYPSSAPTGNTEAEQFALGLRQEGVSIVGGMPADPELRAYKLGAEIQDFRDGGHDHTALTTGGDYWSATRDTWAETQGMTSRDIHYTVRGSECIRINEIMVRPVRRVEAEAVTDVPPSNPEYSPRLDPTPYNFALGFDYGTFMPEFWLTREGFIPGSGWIRTGDVLSDRTYWSTTYRRLDGMDDSRYVKPDILQFRFKASSGLPSDRYYLTVNTTQDGTLSTHMLWIPGSGDPRYWQFESRKLQYAIKYVPTGLPPGGGDILDDVDYVYRQYDPNFDRPPEEVDPYFDNWIDVPREWVRDARGLPAPSAFLPQLAAAGAVYRVYAPYNPTRTPSHYTGYYYNDPAFAVEVGAEPPFAPGITHDLCVAFRINPDFSPGSPAEIAINHFDFSQEPDFEWVEVVNIHDQPVDLSGWQLEVGGEAEESRVLMTVPNATVIPPRDFLLLALSDLGAGTVQLECAELQQIGLDVGLLAERVLSGGIFPNYPEHDGLDNDRDNAELQADGVDNNGDGIVDEWGEGVDEGRYWFDGPDIPVFGGGTAPRPVPGSYSDLEIMYRIGKGDGSVVVLSPLDSSNNYQYRYLGLGSFLRRPPDQRPLPSDPPEWKAFVERRFFPGDCVVLTLYEGPAYKGQIADRVTYSELDVTNAAIDDLLTLDLNGDGFVLPGQDLREPLNVDYPTFWPRNSMGLDFYKSLERKHPLWHGDRFGISNRWQATDGSYDDWAPNMGVATRPRDGSGTLSTWPPALVHLMNGSPLERNIYQRFLEDPALRAAGTGVTLSGIWIDSSVDGWAFNAVSIPNNKVPSAGALLALAHMGFTETVYANTGAGYLARETLDGLLLGQAFPDDFPAVLSSGVTDSLVLTVGQADFYPLTPSGADIIRNPDLVGWDNNLPQAWTPVFLYPLGETPDTSVEIINTVPQCYEPLLSLLPQYPLVLKFLLGTPAFLGPSSAPYTPAVADLRARWPLDLRAVMYVSGNLEAFNPQADPITPDNAAEALFVWDGADGVENGTYDVYVAVCDDLEKLRRDGLQYDAELLDRANGALPGDLHLYLEAFTDRDNDGRCWMGAPMSLPTRDSLDRGLTGHTDPRERMGDTLGVQFGTPNREGLIHYGEVLVENNYMAMFVRNWSGRGVLNRFSRIILSPRQRTPGRININTVETRITRPADQKLFNGLLGLPGMLAYVDTDITPTYLPFMPAVSYVPPLMDATYVPVPIPEPNTLSAQDLLERTRRIIRRRTTHEDGRYYDFASVPAKYEPSTTIPGALIGTLITTTKGAAASQAARPDRQFQELVFRYTRLANMITTRSDTFDIVVTAQAGYGQDENGDGKVNYRSDEEFIVMAEKKLHTVYER